MISAPSRALSIVRKITNTIQYFSVRVALVLFIFTASLSLQNTYAQATSNTVIDQTSQGSFFVSEIIDAIRTSFTLSKIGDKSITLSNTTSRYITVVGGNISLSEENHLISLVPGLSHIPATLSNIVKSYGSFAFNTLPVSADEGSVALSTSVSASQTPVKKNLPFLDQLSLTLFCSLASFSTTLDKEHCDYNRVATGAFTTSLVIATTTQDVVTSTSSLLTALTTPQNQVPVPTTIITTPTYVTNYVTKYVPVPGPAGADGKDGTNGKDSIDSAGGFGGYVYPTTTQYFNSTPNLVGASTIGYLRGATIEYSSFLNGTSTGMYITNATVNDSRFTGSNIFSGLANFTGDILANNFTATSSTLLNSTTTNGFVTNLQATNASLDGAIITNSTTTNGVLTNLFATNATTTNSVVQNLTVASSTFGDSTTTNAFIQSLTVGSSSTGSLVVNGSLTVAGTSTFATTTATDLTATRGFFSNLIATIATITGLTATNSTTTNAVITNASVANSTTTNAFAVNASTTNATSTNFFSTNGTISSFFSNLATIVGLTVTNSTTTNATSTNLFATLANITGLFATNGTITNATTTNLFTQNLAVGNSSTTGNQTIDGSLRVSGTSTLGANVYLNGNVTVGTSSNELFTVNALVNSNFVPAANKMYDLGSNSFYWRNLYADNINVNTISAASTTISGTSNNDFTLNSDNATSDAENMSLIFFRGLVTPNAVIRWNSLAKRLEANQSFKVQNETPSVGTTTLTVQSGAGQSSTNLLEILNYAGAKLSAFTSNGWLGIGSSTPTSALTVVGDAYVGGNVTATGTLNVAGQSTFSTASSTALTVDTLYNSVANLINASTTNLTVSSTAYFGGNTGIWKSNGVVGIGTTTPAGFFDVQGGTTSIAGGNGLPINLIAQNASNLGATAAGGNINITAGNSYRGAGASVGGGVTITGGMGGSGGSGAQSRGGTVTVQGGPGGSTGNGGTLTLIGGTAGATGVTGGAVSVSGGTAVEGGGGSVTISSANAASALGTGNFGGGTVNIFAGQSVGSGTGGAISITGGGTANASGTPGTVSIRGGLNSATTTPFYANLLLQASGGFVGIGSSTPGTALVVVGTTTLVGSVTSTTALKVTGNIDNTGTISNPVIVGSLASGFSSPRASAISGRYLYAVDGNNIKVIDISNPSSPAVVGTVAGGTTPVAISVLGRYAYVVNQGSSNMQVIDISNPSSPTVVGTVAIANSPNSVFVSGRYAYVANDSNSLQVIDISNPSSPTVVGTVATGSGSRATVSGRYAYVINSTSSTLQIVDISNPSSPTVLSTTSLGGGDAYDIKVSGRYAYIVSNLSGLLQIVDISNPSSPAILSSGGDGTAHPRSISISGRYAYIAGGSGYLSIVDVSNPASFTALNTVSVGGAPNFVSVSGHYAYVGNAASISIKVIDINGLETTSAIIHSLEAGNLSVANDITTQGMLAVGTGLTIGSGGFASQGNSSVYGSLSVSGTSTLGTASTTPGALTFYNAANGFTTTIVSSSSQTANLTFTLPGTTGSSNQALLSDGVGGMYWGAAGISGGTNGYLVRFTGTNTTATSSLYDSGNGNIGLGTVNAGNKLSIVNDVVGSTTPKSGIASFDSLLLASLDGGTFLGRSRISESPLSLSNYGVTWVPRDSSRSWRTVAMSSDGRIQTATAYGGNIYTSTDYGVTWTARDSSRNWYGVAMSSDGRIQTVAVNGGNIYTSTDYGVTWTARDSSRSWRTAAMSSDGRIQTALNYGGQIYTSTDYGVTWTARDSSRNWNGVALSSDGRIQTTSTLNDQIYTSTDYGVTWTARDSSRSWAGITLSSDGRVQTAVVGGGNIYTSTDYGVTWTARDSSRNWNGIAVSSDGRIQTATVINGLIYTSTDYGVTWTARDSSRNWYGVAMSSDGRTQTSVANSGQIYTSTADAQTLGNLVVGTSTSQGVLTVVGTTTLVGSSTSPTALKVIGNIDNTSSAQFNPTVLGTVTTGANPQTVVVSGRYAYVGNAGASTIQVVDVSTPTSPVVISTFTMSGVPNSLTVSGRYLYVINSSNQNLQVIDISNPSSLLLVGTIYLQNLAAGNVAVSGRYAYVTGSSNNNFGIVDISNPTAMVLLKTVSTGNSTQGVTVVGRYAYVTNVNAATVQIIDISNPLTASVVSTVSTGSSPNNIAVSGRYAYIVNFFASTFQILNIASSTAPTVVATTTTGAYPTSVSISGRYAYITNQGSSTMQVIDVASSTAPVTVGIVTVGSSPYGVTNSGRYAYVTNNNSNSLQVIDVGGIETASEIVGSSEIGQLQVKNDVTVQGNIFTQALSAANALIDSLSARLASFATLAVGAVQNAATATSNALLSLNLTATSTSVLTKDTTEGFSISGSTNSVGVSTSSNQIALALASTTVIGNGTMTTGPSLSTGNTYSGANAIQRPDGKFLIIDGGISTATNIYDPVANTFATGPTLTANVGYGSHAIQRPDGKFLVIIGNQTATTNIYDPVANTFIAGPSLASGSAFGGAHSILRPDGKFLIINGNTTTATNIYDPVANSFASGPTLTATADFGSHSIQRPDGKFLVVRGLSTAVTNIYDPVANTFVAGPSLASGTAYTGSHSIQRPDGKFLIIDGNDTVNTNIYDPVANTFVAGPSLTATAGFGSHSIQRPDGKFLVMLASGNGTTNIYDPVTNTFVAGPNLSTGTTANGAFSIQRPDGKFLIVNGNSTAVTNIYDPSYVTSGSYESEDLNITTLNSSSVLNYSTNGEGTISVAVKTATSSAALAASYTVYATTTSGSKFIPVDGAQYAKVKITLTRSVPTIQQPYPNSTQTYTWIGSSDTKYQRKFAMPIVYNFSINNQTGYHVSNTDFGTANATTSIGINATSSGPTVSNISTDGGLTLPYTMGIPGGAATGDQLGSVTTGPTLSTNGYIGAMSIQRPDGKFLIFVGNSLSTTNIYDPATNLITTGPSLASGGPGSGSHVFQRPDGKFFVVNGGSATTNIYDPVANTFTTGPTLVSGNAGLGSHSIQRPDGKFLIVTGNNTATTNIYDPVTNTMTVGPTLASGNAYTAAHSLQRPDGKFLLVNGGGSSTTNIYDPVTNTFSAGPSLSAVAGAGAHSLQRPDGKFYIISGGGTTNTSLYDPIGNAMSSATALSNAPTTGAHSIQRPDGKFLIFIGGGSVTNIYDPVGAAVSAGPSFPTNKADGSHSLQRPDGKFLVVDGNITATTNIYDQGWVTRGYYESEFINDTTLSSDSVFTWTGNADAYKAGAVSVRVRTATSSDALASSTWRTIPVSGGKINPGTGEVWMQVHFDLNRPIASVTQPGAGKNVWLGASSVVYNRLPLLGSAGYTNQAQVFIKPTIYSYQIQKQAGGDFATFALNGQNVFRFSATGQAYTTQGGSWNAGGADVAEYFPVASDSLLSPGDVVSVSQKTDGLADMTTSAYDETLIGVVTTAPGVLLGNDDVATLQYKQPIALAGRVPVKISLENGPIHKGDYITSSSKAGYAMKAVSAGRVLGVALADYTLADDTTNNGAGTVLVMVNPTFYTGASFTNSVGSVFSGLAISVRKAISEFGVTLTDSGAVGLGVADPLSRFHVAGDIRTGVASSTAGRLIFQNAVNGYTTTLQSATGTLASDLAFTLPSTLGTASQALLSDGTGALYFGNVAIIASSTQARAGYVARFVTDNEVGTGTLLDDGIVAGVNATSSDATFTVKPASTTTNPLAVTSYEGNSYLSILANGNAGLGTASSTSRLDITSSGDTDFLKLIATTATSPTVMLRITSVGDLITKGSLATTDSTSVSETYPAIENLDAGTVVAFATEVSTTTATTTTFAEGDYQMVGVRKAANAYEALGVISAKSGIILAAGTKNGVPVVLTGRVPVRVTTENGEVQAGDYLTVSKNVPGFAMKLTGEGKSLGRALSSYVQGSDKVLMIVDTGTQRLDLTGKYATTTGMLTTGNVDLNANGVAITNIKSLASANGTWSIGEDGRITAKVLCLEDVCIDKNTLTNILNSTGQSGVQNQGSSTGGVVLGDSTSTVPTTGSSSPETGTSTEVGSNSSNESNQDATTTPEASGDSTTGNSTSSVPDSTPSENTGQ